MNSPQELINLVRSYGAKLKPLDDNQLKVINSNALPSDLIEQLRANKIAVIQHIKQSYFDTVLQRALNGYHWLLQRKEQQHRYNHIPVSDVQINVQEWRQVIANVIGLDTHEVQVIENVLINSGQLLYYNGERCITSPQELDTCGADNHTGQAFNDWLNTGRQFLNH